VSEQTPPKTRRDIEAHIIAQAWKDEAYKQELLSNPKVVFEREFGAQLPTEANVCVHEENVTNFYFVLPMRPDLSGAELSDEQLEAIAGGSTPVCGLVSAAAVVGGFLASQALTP
jgi:Nitrile hydratase, alpha chain